MSVLRLQLFQHSHDSFLEALDAEDIPHCGVQQYSTGPQNSALIESISALSEAMPWNSIAKVMVAWIESRKSREIMITTEDNQIIHLKGYSVSDAKKIIKSAANVAIIDTLPHDKT